MAGSGRLRPAQERAVAALLAERDVRAAAEVAGVGERSLHRWLADPGFMVELRKQEDRLLDGVVRRLLGLAGDALEVLQGVMGDDVASDGVRVRAALGVLTALLAVRELRDVEARLEALEVAVAARDRTAA